MRHSDCWVTVILFLLTHRKSEAVYVVTKVCSYTVQMYTYPPTDQYGSHAHTLFWCDLLPASLVLTV